MENKGEVRLPALGHVGIIVKDIDKTMEYYSSTFGIGPWRVRDADYHGVMLRGQKTSYKARLAFAETGTVELQLTQPISGRSIYSEFLDEVGEGIHHLGYLVGKKEKEDIISKLAEQGIKPIMAANSVLHSGSWAYLEPVTGGVMFELVHRPTPLGEWKNTEIKK